MTDENFLAERFEENRNHLRAVAYRMLGSLNEADDAIQEAWLRLSRSDAASIQNLGGWLTTVVARVCLDMLRSRNSRREESLSAQTTEPIARGTAQSNPEQETLLADSVGLALLVVLDRLSPAERLAFVLHDLFAVPFEDIASILGRTPKATRQLASRGRRRVQGPGEIPSDDLAQQRKVIDLFLAALRAGDVEGVVAVLDPDVLVHIEGAAPGAPSEIRGARNWAKGAVAFAQAARRAEAVLVDGTVGLVFAPRGRLFRVVKFTIAGERIVEVDIIADASRLRELDLGVLPE